MKAIETHYAGCRFRSRLEARWAVFFNTLKWDWQFEPEGFQLDSGWYLPDFLVQVGKPAQGCGERWIEVKPFKKEKSDPCPIDPRWQDLARGSKTPIMTVYGMHRVGDGCEARWKSRKIGPHAGRISVRGEDPTLLGPFWTEEPFGDAWNAASRERFGT